MSNIEAHLRIFDGWNEEDKVTFSSQVDKLINCEATDTIGDIKMKIQNEWKMYTVDKQTIKWMEFTLRNELKIAKEDEIEKMEGNKIFLDVFIDGADPGQTETTARVSSLQMNRNCWIVTGGKTDFRYYPIPAKTEEGNVVKMKSKNLEKFLKNQKHFLLAMEDGTQSGRWAGKSYTYDFTNKDCTIVLQETANIDDLKVLIKFEDSSTDTEELKPNDEGKEKVFFWAEMEAREKKKNMMMAAGTTALTAIGLIIQLLV